MFDANEINKSMKAAIVVLVVLGFAIGVIVMYCIS